MDSARGGRICFTSNEGDAEFEEEILKRRLVVDGDGRGDDKRIGSLMQDYVAWVTSNNSRASESKPVRVGKIRENETVHKRLLMEVEYMQLLTLKTVETIATVNSVQAQYDDLQAEIRVAMNIHRQQLIAFKEQSITENRLKQQRMECEAVIQLLKSFPDRKKMGARFSYLSTELRLAQAKRNELETKISIQKQKLALLIQCSKDLAATLEGERPLMSALPINAADEIKNLNIDKTKENNGDKASKVVEKPSTSGTQIIATDKLYNLKKGPVDNNGKRASTSMGPRVLYNAPNTTVEHMGSKTRWTSGPVTPIRPSLISSDKRWTKPLKPPAEKTLVVTAPKNDSAAEGKIDPCSSKRKPLSSIVGLQDPCSSTIEVCNAKKTVSPPYLDLLENSLPLAIEFGQPEFDDGTTPRSSATDNGKDDDYGLYEDIMEAIPEAENSFVSESDGPEFIIEDEALSSSQSGSDDGQENDELDGASGKNNETYLVDETIDVQESCRNRVTLHYENVPIRSPQDKSLAVCGSDSTDELTAMELELSMPGLGDIEMSESQSQPLKSVESNEKKSNDPAIFSGARGDIKNCGNRLDLEESNDYNSLITTRSRLDNVSSDSSEESV